MPQSEKTEVAEKPELFGTDLSEYEANISKEHFKCIISPESQNVDLRLLTAKLIERLENMTGYKLYWQACIHTNTPHRHAHLAINGTDRNGRKVRFSREVIKTQIRNLLSDMTTAMVESELTRRFRLQKKNFRSPLAGQALMTVLCSSGKRFLQLRLTRACRTDLLILQP